MYDLLKIVLKATLDKNTEQEINSQLKKLKIEPIEIKLNLKQNNNKIIQETENVFNQISKSVKKFSSEIIKHFGITNRNSVQEVKKAAEELFTAFQIKDQNQITKSYDNLFNKIKDSFYKLKVEMTDSELDFLNYFKSHKIYIDDYIKSDFNKDEWKYYRDNLRGIYTANAKKGTSINSLSGEIYGQFGDLFLGDLPFNAHDEFRQIVDKFIETRRKLKDTIGDTEIEHIFGSDEDIRNNINSILNTYISSINSKEPQVKEAVEKVKQDIESLTRVENKLEEREKEYEILDIKAQKAGIGLNPDYIDSFYEALANKDLEESRHNLSMLQKEWRALNATMEKEMPNTALENMKKNISLMPIAIESVEIRLKRLSNPSKELQDKVAGLKGQLDKLKNSQSNDEQLDIYGKLKQNILSINKALTNQIQTQRQLNQERNLGVEKQTFLNRINLWLRENSKAAKVFSEDIARIKSQIEGADRLTLNNLKKQFTEVNTRAKSMGIAGKNVIEKMLDSFKNVSSLFVGGSFALYAIHALREVYNNVVAIDSAMVNLKKVTDETASTYQKFLSNATKSAIKLGVGVPDIINATANFARLGYQLKDASVLGETAALYKNVSYTDIGTATQDIISAMKAFKIEAKDSTKIIDKLNEVGNRFSISSAGLGEGLRRSSASLAIANNTLDESLALITAANETIQNPSEAGNAVKILALRLTGAKGKLEELGESTDNVVESVTALQTKLLNLTGGKVNIMADQSTFKSTYRIIQELGSIWNELTGVQRSSILELIAGKQRQNAIASLIQNIQTAKDVVEVASNSAGSAMKEQEKRMDSINAKVEQFKANVQNLSQNLINSSIVKFFVDLGSAGISTLDKMAEKFGSLTTILTTFSTISSLIGKQPPSFLFGKIKNPETGNESLSWLGKSFDEIGQDWKNAPTIREKIGSLFISQGRKTASEEFAKQLEIDKQALNQFSIAINNHLPLEQALAKTMSNASEAAVNYAKSTQVTGDFTGLFVSKQKEAATAMEVSRLKTIGLTLAQAALNATITFGVSLAIEGLIHLIHQWVTADQRAIETSNELIKKNEEESKSLKDKAKTIDSIKEDYQRLSKGIGNLGENVGLTTSEYQKYNDIANQIAELFPELVQGRTAEGNAIIKQKGNIELLNKALQNHIELLESQKLTDSPKVFEGLGKQLFNIKDILNPFTVQASLINQFKTSQEIIKNIDVAANEVVNGSIEQIENNKKKIEELKNILSDDSKNLSILNLFKKAGVEIPNFANVDDLLNIIINNKDKIIAAYKQIQAEFNSQSSQMVSEVIIPNIVSNSTFKRQPLEIKNFIRSMVESMDFSSLSDDDKTYIGINNWVNNNILKPILENRDNVQDKLRELFSLDANNIKADEYVNKVNDLVEQISSIVGINADTLKEKLGFSEISSLGDETAISFSRLSREVDNLDISLNSTEKDINNMVSILSQLDDVIKKVEEGTSLSGQEISKLILEYPELADKIMQTNEGYTFEIDVLNKLREAKINERKVTIEAELDKTRETLNNISERIKGYQWEIGAINNVAEARQALNEVRDRQQNQSLWDKFWRGITGKPQLDKVGKDLETYINLSNKIEKTQKRINALQVATTLPTMSNFTKTSNQSAKAIKNHTDALNKNKKALDEQKKALESQKKTLEDNQKSINSLIDMTVKMIKRQKETEKSALKESLDGYKKKIDLMKKSLDTQKDEYNYTKELNEKNLSISRIQVRLASMQNDDSAEARKRRAELNEQLRKEQNDLDKYLYDHSVDSQKKSLDEQYNQYKNNTDKQVQAIDDYLKHEGNLRQEAMALIESKTQEFYNNLTRWNLEYGDGTTATVVNTWNKAYDALGRFNSGQIDVSWTLATISSQMSGIDSKISGINTQIDNVTKSMDNFKNSTDNAARALNLASQEHKKLADAERQRASERENELTRLQRIASNLDKGIYPAATYYSNKQLEQEIKNKIPTKNKNVWDIITEPFKNIGNVFSKLPHLFGYASGTKAAKKGLATVDEKGKEIILGKTNDGRYRFMNEGDVVFSKEATDKLWELANSKTNFIGQKVIPQNMTRTTSSNKLSNISSPIINIDIKGNADIETVNALKRESDKIVKKAVELTFKTANKQAKII